MSQSTGNPPKDGTRILIQYYDKRFNGREYVRCPEPKWEEAWWNNTELHGSQPHWQPWLGSYRNRSTKLILDEDVVNWMKIPIDF